MYNNTRKKILIQISKKLNWKLWKKIKNFSIYILESIEGKNLYRIVGEMPSDANNCINLISDSKIRETISNGSMKCELLERKNKTVWYEKIIFNSDSKNPLYSIEKIIINLKNNAILTYSEEPNNNKGTNDYNKRNNLFTLIKFKNITTNKCKITVILSFNEFEMGQESIVKASIEHFDAFKQTL